MDKIKVGSINYEIKYVPVVEIDQDRNYNGACRYQESTIEVLESLSTDRKDEILIHELVHAILFEAGYSEHDEDMVVRFSKVLTQVLKDNEKIIK